jgi:hypothetical protein
MTTQAHLYILLLEEKILDTLMIEMHIALGE